MDLLGTYATSTFEATVGFPADNFFAWATTSIMHIYIGGAIAILNYLTLWLIAGLVIGGIIYVGLNAMHFFRH